MESTIRGEVLFIWRSQASFFFDDDDAYSIAIFSCRNRWRLKFKPKIDGCSKEEWTLEEVIISISCMVVV